MENLIFKTGIKNLNKNIISFDFFFLFFKNCFLKNKKVIKAPFFYFIEMSNKFIDINSNYLLCLQYKITANLNFFKKYPFKPSFEDFYQTDSFSKNSLNMFKRSKEIRKISTNFY